jgi:arylsulfatase A-like enzyme
MENANATSKLTRRFAVKLGLAAASISSVPAAASSAPRPNILWLVSEDNNPLIGAYGDTLAQTPNIDALASRGILYRNAYAVAPVCAPSRFAILTGVHPQSTAPANHQRAVAKLPAGLRSYPEYLRHAGYHCTNNDKTDYNCDIDPDRIWDASSRTAHWRDRPKGKPFMAVFNYMTTHEMMLFSPTAGVVKSSAVRIPQYLPDTPAIRTDFASYYNMMAKLDKQVGARLKELDDDGLTEDTIVFYFSDHGGALSRSKRYCYEEGLHCALIVYLPPKWAHLSPHKAGSQIDAPVSLVDLAPTLLSLIDSAKPSVMQGSAFLGVHRKPAQRFVFGMRNRMDERYDFVRTVSDGRYRYIRNYMPHRPWGMHSGFGWQAKGYQDWERQYLAGKLTPAQARFFGPKPYEEFYDRQTDPDEIDNRIADAKLKRMVKEFRRALDAQILQIVDNGFIPEGSSLEGYHESRTAGAYPLRRVMTLAQAAARADPRKISLFRAGLTDSNEVVRYWAATGLLILADKSAMALPDLRAAAHGDTVPQVRVVAAEALVRAGEVDAGVTVLAALARPDQSWEVRLQALNALTGIGDSARGAIAEIQLATEDKQEYLLRAGHYLLAKLDGTYEPGRQLIR